MRLIISEKPSTARAIANVIGATERHDGYLSGNGYAVSHCFGHLAELAEPESYNESYGKWRQSDLPIIPDNWQYSIGEDKKKQFEILSKLMNDTNVTEVINACDAGREGELIFRTVYNLAGCTKPIKRLWISSMEDAAIRAGFENLRPGSDYDNLYYAALCRSKADWLVGINATRLFSVLYHRTLNVGRVVSPTLAMIVEREAEIKAHKSELFYKAEIDFDGFTAESARFSDKEKAEEAMLNCGSTATVKSVERKEKTEKPPTLYDLTTLQRAANRNLGFTAKQTLDCLQSLYEKKLTTYPRTDSKFLTDDMKNSVAEIAELSAEFLVLVPPKNIDTSVVCNSRKVSDHHAIILTKSVRDIDVNTLLPSEREILKLIAKRTLSALSEPYSYVETTAVISCGNTDFITKGKSVVNLGWRVYANSDIKETDLKGISEGNILTPKATSVVAGKTTPLKHYTEDTILSAMEKAGAADIPDEAERKGIGTPATRAGIIEKLVSTGFVTRNKAQKSVSLIPDNIGESLITILPEELQSPLLTAQWEQQLLMIEKGELSPDEFMSAIEESVKALVRDYKIIDGAEVLFPSGKPVVGKCPHCGSNVTESKTGYFCEKNSCRFALWKDNRFLSSKHIGLTAKMTETLLRDGRAYVRGIYSERTGKQYDAYVTMTDDGTKTTFGLEFDNKNGGNLNG